MYLTTEDRAGKLRTYTTYINTHTMSQLHFYIPDELEKVVRRQAEEAHLPLSRYLAELVKREAQRRDEWPDGYFEAVFGRWEGGPLNRESEGAFEQRSPLE